MLGHRFASVTPNFEPLLGPLALRGVEGGVEPFEVPVRRRQRNGTSDSDTVQEASSII